MRGKNRFRCVLCFYQWVEQRGKRKNYQKAYDEWLMKRRTLAEICLDFDVSYPKLMKEFDSLDEVSDGIQVAVGEDPDKSINLIVDATFFGRKYGFLILRDCQKVLYFKEIKTESVKHLCEGIMALKAANYNIKSVTIDGRKGYINNIRKLLGNIPIQMCLFHQKAIVRRYITDKPRNQCAIELKDLMYLICKSEKQQEFINQFYYLKEKYHSFLHERNELGSYKHQALRSAIKSIETNLLYLFTYTDFKGLNIPSTINHLEGLFGHLKTDLKIHRGLKENRKKKAVKFFLRNFGKKAKNSITFF